MTLLETVKKSIRVTGTAADYDYEGIIAACKEDLRRVGWSASKVVDSDTRCIEACKLYTKWRIDYQGKGDRYGENYREYRDGTAQNVEYMEVE